ncbi:hypothetical protein OH77DRAFT_152151 [Trametes cingulata]|nr:hypothetical protein OH77DRAFT_152151 [Trametes cingulata]
MRSWLPNALDSTEDIEWQRMFCGCRNHCRSVGAETTAVLWMHKAQSFSSCTSHGRSVYALGRAPSWASIVSASLIPTTTTSLLLVLLPLCLSPHLILYYAHQARFPCPI